MRENLIEQLLEKNDIAGIEKLTYYERLGIRRDLDPIVFAQQVVMRHQILLRKVKPLSENDTRPIQIVMLITEAVNVLLDDDKRQRYDQLLKIYLGLQSPVKKSLFFVEPQKKNLDALCKDLHQLTITNPIITKDNENDSATPPTIGLSKL